MNRLIKLALFLCLALTASALPHPAFSATVEEIAARLNVLEKENAALRARVNRLEASKATRLTHRTADAEPNPALAARPRPHYAEAMAAHAGARPWISSPRFEVSGSLLFLQAGAGNLEYGTLVTPLPLATPNWSNQSLAPKFKAAFRIGARYMPNESNDIELNWTHHDSTTNDSFLASPTQMVGPPYLIGPESGLYKVGSGSVQSRYDAVNLDGGHTFCAECDFQFRVFGGVAVARIGQNLSGLFQSPDGLASSGYTTTSLFTGAGPRLGINGQYAFGDFQLIGELAGAGLIGSSQSQINFTTVSPAVGVNNQSLTSPNAIQLVPSIDAKLAAAYNFAPSQYGQFKVEVGYRAAVYFNAVGQYVMTQVPTSLVLPPVGVYLATAQHIQSNFTEHGPYFTAGWLF